MTFQQNIKGKQILVTGAGGFIGSHLVEALLGHSAQVRAFVHYNSRNDWGLLEELGPSMTSGIEVISADLRDYHAVKQASKGVEIVSIITRESAESLQLAEGKDAYAVIKASNVMIAID